MPINVFVYFGAWVLGALLVGFFIFRAMSRRLSGVWVLLIWLLNLPLGFFVAMSLEQMRLHLSISVLLFGASRRLRAYLARLSAGATLLRRQMTGPNRANPIKMNSCAAPNAFACANAASGHRVNACFRLDWMRYGPQDIVGGSFPRYC